MGKDSRIGKSVMKWIHFCLKDTTPQQVVFRGLCIAWRYTPTSKKSVDKKYWKLLAENEILNGKQQVEGLV